MSVDLLRLNYEMPCHNSDGVCKQTDKYYCNGRPKVDTLAPQRGGDVSAIQRRLRIGEVDVKR